jgi:uncharacterized protein
MRAMWLVLTVAVLVAAAEGEEKPAPSEPKPAERIKVLLVTGVDHPAHDWKKTAPALRDLLQEDKRFEVRITEDPDQLGTDLMFGYDVVLLHFKNYKPLAREDQARANLTRLVREGKGLVVLHFASGAFGEWPEFANLAGKVWDRKTGHDPRGPFAVDVVSQSHPITRGMTPFQADDELYTCLVGDREIELLAVAHSKVTKQDHPMAFVLHSGKGRVFHTPLGHDVKAIQMPGVAQLIRRGCAWAAGREP